jgi:uncharacterized membrane protein YqgA involved in biofilm formation
MLGTLYNAAAVGIGASLGLVLGPRLPEGLRKITFQALGLFTLGLGILMANKMQDPFAVFLALVIGAGVGQTLGLHERLERWTFGAASGGLIQAVLLFCVGAMTVVGCMEDALHDDPSILYAKGTMDLISSAFLAAAAGRGVLWAAPAVLLIQGALTLGFMGLGDILSPALIQEGSALGGLLLLGLGLDLLQIRTLPLVNFLPALLLLPLVRWVLESLPL